MARPIKIDFPGVKLRNADLGQRSPLVTAPIIAVKGGLATRGTLENR